MNSLVMIQPALLSVAENSAFFTAMKAAGRTGPQGDGCRQYSFDEGPPQPVLLDATSLKPGSLCTFLPGCAAVSTTSSLRHLSLGLWGGRGTCHVAPSAPAERTCESGSANVTCRIPGDSRDEVSVCVCVFVYIYIYNIHTHTQTYICMYAYIYIYI